MRLKSYFAGTVEAAMALAREELGPDAMLVHSKKATPETRHIGQYEVVFALAEPEPAPVRQTGSPSLGNVFASAGSVFASERGDSAIERLSMELTALKRRIEGMSSALKPERPLLASPEDSELQALIRVLTTMDVDREIAEEIARAGCSTDRTLHAHPGLDQKHESGPGQERYAVTWPGSLRSEGNVEGSRSRWSLGHSLGDEIRRRVTVDATLGVANDARRIVALVGPPGAGKTTALVKLAARYGLASRRSMHFISTDVFRVGSAEQLRLYASILGVGFQTIETPLALAQALEEQRRKDLIFIDTPGRVHADVPEIQDLAASIASDPDIDVHLVLPASNRAADLRRTVNRYAIFRPGKLLFTRIDETDCFGPLLNVSLRTGKPLSFLSTGEQIPEDIEAATEDRVVELLSGYGAPDDAESILSAKELH